MIIIEKAILSHNLAMEIIYILPKEKEYAFAQ
jgi:hypothetical protein